MEYRIVAEAYRDLEQATGRLALIEQLATLLTQTRPACCRWSATCARA